MADNSENSDDSQESSFIFWTKIVLALLAFLIITLRAFYPPFQFDQISFFLFLTAAIILLLPDLSELINRISKIRHGKTEIDFENDLEDLSETADEAQEDVQSEGYQIENISEELDEFLSTSDNPRASLMMLAREIERRVREVATETGIAGENQVISVKDMMEKLVEEEFIRPKTLHLFNDFWTVRNKVVHGAHYEAKDEHIYELVEIGVRLLRLLYSRPGE